MDPTTASRGTPHRLPLVERRQIERATARRRVAARTVRGLTPEQLAHDPAARPRRLPSRLLVALAVVVGSTLVHGSVVGAGVLIFGMDGRSAPSRERVTIVVRERERPPAKPPQPSAPPPAPEVAPDASAPMRPPAPAARRQEAARKPAIQPSERPAGPKPPAAPARVVGLSLEATVEGSGGPSFAVGNTLEGETAGRAAAPAEVPRDPGSATAAPAAPGPAEAGPRNVVASRIPSAGVQFVLPKRARPSTPVYPAELKAQGIEADVPVMVSIDAAGAVTAVKVLRPSGYPELDEAARAAALSEAYEPATRNGTPVPYSLSFTYRFRLEDR